MGKSSYCYNNYRHEFFSITNRVYFHHFQANASIGFGFVGGGHHYRVLEDETQQEFVSDQQGSEHFYRPFGGFGRYRRYGGFGGFGGFGGYRRFGGYGPYGGYRPYGGYGWGR